MRGNDPFLQTGRGYNDFGGRVRTEEPPPAAITWSGSEEERIVLVGRVIVVSVAGLVVLVLVVGKMLRLTIPRGRGEGGADQVRLAEAIGRVDGSSAICIKQEEHDSQTYERKAEL